VGDRDPAGAGGPAARRGSGGARRGRRLAEDIGLAFAVALAFGAIGSP
jgi:hypothetical protein